MRVLIVDAESSFALPVARCLGQVHDVRVFSLSSMAWSSVRFSRWTEHTAIRPPSPEEETVANIIECGTRMGAEVLIVADEWAVPTLQKHRERLALSFALPPLPPPPLLESVTNKALLASLLHAKGIAHPPTVVLSGIGENLERCATLRFPVVVKPSTSRGGRGISMKMDQRELHSYLAELPPSRYPLVAQEYIAGNDYCCNVLCREGELLAYTIQRTLVHGRGRFSPGAVIEFIEHDGILDLARQFIAVTHWSGIANIDFRVAEQGARLVLLEVNPRFWGTLLGSLHAGVNFPYAMCLTALGKPLPALRFRRSTFIARNKTALKALVWRDHSHEGIPHSGFATSLRYAVKDPLPEVLSVIRSAARLLHRLFRRLLAEQRS